MKVLIIILAVTSPLILYALALVLAALKARYLPARCPRCSQRGLVNVNHIRATVLVDGQRAPDHWSYARCSKCRARLKNHRGEWSDVKDDEWEGIALRR